MGQACKRACPGYTPLGTADADEDGLQSAKEERLHSFELMFGDSLRRASRNIWWAGALRWGSLPLTVALGVKFGTCRDGLPTALYVLPCASALLGWAQERCAIHQLWTFCDIAEDHLGLGDGPEDADVRQYLDAFKAAFAMCSPPCCTWRLWTLLRHWLCLQVFGLLSALDLITDALMTGQVKRCEDGLDRDFKHEFAMAWVVPGFTVLEHIGFTLDQIGLAGLCLATLIGTMVVQGVYGLCHANRLINLATSVVADSVLLPVDDCCSLLGMRDLSFSRRMVEIAETGAVAGEWAAATYTKEFFIFLAGEFGHLRLDRSAKRLGAVAEHEDETAKEVHRFHIQVGSVIRVVLLHTVPFMYMMLVFMTLVFNGVFDSQARAKLAFSFILSLMSTLMQAWWTLKMTRCSSCYLFFVPPITAFIVLALVLALAVSFAMSFTCRHYVFSILAFECVNGTTLPADETLYSSASSAYSSALSHFVNDDSVVPG